MLDAVYKFVNQSNFNITDDCWFCLTPAPPCYVGLGAIASLGTGETQIQNVSATNSSICQWEKIPKLTLEDLQGLGTCVLTPSYNFVSSPYTENSNSTLSVNPTTPTYLIAPQGTWFACNTGLTPCINLNYWRKNAGFCILVHVISQVYFYSGERGKNTSNI